VVPYILTSRNIPPSLQVTANITSAGFFARICLLLERNLWWESDVHRRPMNLWETYGIAAICSPDLDLAVGPGH
jgi:hypothetical protein